MSTLPWKTKNRGNLNLNREIKKAAIALRQVHRLKRPDAIIAATAQPLQATLYTNDLKLLGLPRLSAQALPLIELA
ncbi:hypothetical protein [Thiocystis violascens]|uniref:hypothetical protein n=1 Tax=Thiocystis violascens TaxID=73141 RepID=UPI00022C38F5|nr:hypothetical protein [Thiocystis violascens]